MERAGWLAACSGVMIRMRSISRDAGVVGGELRALDRPHQVGAAVADVGDDGFVPGEGEGGDGRAHAAAAGLHAGIVDGDVGGAHCARRAAGGGPGAPAVHEASSVSTARRLATSPAAWPPMPSATTHSGPRSHASSGVVGA